MWCCYITTTPVSLDVTKILKFFVRVNYSMVMLFLQPEERLVILLFIMKP